MPTLVSLRKEVPGTSTEIPYWWCVTTQITLGCASGWWCGGRNLFQPIRLKRTTHIWAVILHIPANFYWDVGVRFLSWECWDFWKRHDQFRRLPKKSEVFRRRPKSAEGKVIEKTLIHKIRDREGGIVLTWVWVNIFLEIVSSKTATTHIFQSGVRNWSPGVSGREIEVFNPQAWELAGITSSV